MFRPTPCAVVAIALAAALAGCQQEDSKHATQSGKAGAQPRQAAGTPAAARADDHAAIESVNAYTDAYNKLRGSFGLSETRKDYFALNIAKRSAKDDIAVRDGWIAQGLEPLKKGRAAWTGPAREVDTAAEALAGHLDKLLADLADLERYYKTKAYKDDGLAKGKAQDPVVRGHFDAAVAAMEGLGTALDRHLKQQQALEIAELEKSGQLQLRDIKLGLQQAETLIALFTSEADLKDPAKLRAGGEALPALEATIAAQRAHLARMGVKDANYLNHEKFSGHLDELVGAFRQLRETHTPANHAAMVAAYNGAVSTHNTIISNR